MHSFSLVYFFNSKSFTLSFKSPINNYEKYKNTKIQKYKNTKIFLVAAAVSFTAPVTFAGAIHDASLFTDNTLPRNDDQSSGLTNIGFTINYFGNSYTQLYVNNNGNVSLDTALSTFTPFNLLSTSIPILAPYFADVDTRNPASGLVQYGQDTLNGHNVFGVNWFDITAGVGYFSSRVDKLNEFQLIITDRADIAAGDFDFQFNYDQIQWETGDASSGVNGLGGNSARVGWSNGSTTSFELAGSDINGAFLDSNNSSGLIHNSLNSAVVGQYNFVVRSGVVEHSPISNVPEPASIALIASGFLGFGASRRKKNQA